MASDDIAIKVNNVSKDFDLPHNRKNSVKEVIVHPFSRTTTEKQHTLKNVSLEVKKGEFFGIVGRNGSGKSTLLKILAGVYSPTSGSVEVNGSLVPFIELGVGFNPELTGRDNVYLNGSLLGFSRKQMDEMYDEIVEFAELERFMDQKLKNYSSGMQVRLAFSIAIRAETDIVLIDEVLAVGDENFQKKCLKVFKKLKSAKKTIVFVTHDMNQVDRFCDRAVLINKGVITHQGRPTAIIDAYRELNEDGKVSSKQKISRSAHVHSSDFITTDKIIKTEKLKIPHTKKNIEINFIFTVKSLIKQSLVAGVTLENINGHTVYAYTTEQKKEPLKLNKGTYKFKVQIANVFSEGIYYADFSIVSRDRINTYLRIDNKAELDIQGYPGKEWLLRPRTEVDLEREKI